MNIGILKIVDAGDLSKERVVFSVKVDDFLGGYFAFKTKRNNEKSVSSNVERPYWFPDRDVKKGDLVVLYTKKGIKTEKKNLDNTTTFFFYWGQANPLWKEESEAVLIMKIANWDAKSLKDLQK